MIIIIKCNVNFICLENVKMYFTNSLNGKNLPWLIVLQTKLVR